MKFNKNPNKYVKNTAIKNISHHVTHIKIAIKYKNIFSDFPISYELAKIPIEKFKDKAFSSISQRFSTKSSLINSI